MVESVKRAIKPFYTDVGNVYEKKVLDGAFTKFETVLKFKNMPCRVSAKSYLFGENAGSESLNTLNVNKRVKLFVPPEYEIKPGSTVEVTSLDKKRLYGKSGEMSFYTTHNEVMVEIVKDYA